MSAFWKLSQAIAWIATRDDNDVAEAPNEVVNLWFFETNIDAIAQAQLQLWEALQMGELEATGTGKDGERRAIPATRWLDLRPILENDNEEVLEPRPFMGEGFYCVAVASAEVRKRWPAIPPKGKRGPKPKVDPAKFERKVHRLIAEHGIPDRTLDPDWGQSELEDAMMKWHSDAIKESRNRELVRLAIASYMSRYKGL